MSHGQSAAATLMHAEARESARSVERMLAANAATVDRIGQHLRRTAPGTVATIARGSSDNACTYGRYLIENRLGTLCASAGLSLGSIYHAPSGKGADICIAVSQSGASPDLLAAVTRARLGGAMVIGLINRENALLSALCDEVIALKAEPERSVAATKSFIASLAAFAWIVGEWSQDAALLKAVHDLPGLLDEAWDQDWTRLETDLLYASSLYVLGRGPGLGLAQEAALKLKETCGLHAEAFSAAEVVHGPMALVASGFPVLALAQRDASLATSRTIAELLATRGAKVLFAGGLAKGAAELPTRAAHPAIEPILMAQSFYRAAAALSIARGFDPDRPPHLSKETRTR